MDVQSRGLAEAASCVLVGSRADGGSIKVSLKLLPWMANFSWREKRSESGTDSVESRVPCAGVATVSQRSVRYRSLEVALSRCTAWPEE